MTQIEQAILGLHQDNRPDTQRTSTHNNNAPQTAQVSSEPFARVNAVAPDSPAKEAVNVSICPGFT